MRLTKRDCEIIRLVHRNRFLRSNHIVALLSGSSQQILRRLQRLYHSGYLERPRAQIEYFRKGGSHCIVYGVGTKGSTILRDLCAPSSKRRWGEKNRSVGRFFLEHALFVSDVMVMLELACRERGIRLIAQEELQMEPFRWDVAVHGRKLGVIPDRVFALEYPTEDGRTERSFFFLEADRGTMPIIRSNLSQTSIYRKLIAYQETWSQSIHRTRFQFHRFRVIGVTQSASRLESIVNTCSQLKRGHGLFLFKDWSQLQKQGAKFFSEWHCGDGKKTDLLSLGTVPPRP